MRSSKDAFNLIGQGLEANKGRFTLVRTNEEWICGIEWGQEAPDSPMYGGAAYSRSTVAAGEAVDKALDQTGWTLIKGGYPPVDYETMDSGTRTGRTTHDTPNVTEVDKDGNEK